MSFNRIIVYFCVVFCPSILIFSQTAFDAAKIKSELSGSLPDSVRLLKLKQLVWHYTWADTNNTLADDYITEAIGFANKNKLPVDYKLRWLNSEIYKRQKNYLAAYYEILIVLKEDHKRIPKSEHIKIHLLSAFLMTQLADYYNAIETYTNLLEFQKDKLSDDEILNSHLEIARINYLLNYKEPAIKYFKLTGEIAKERNDYKTLSDVYLGIGDIALLRDSNYSESLIQYKKCLQYSFLSKDTGRIVFALRRTAWSYFQLKQYKSALENYNKMTEYSISSNDSNSIANAYSNIAAINRLLKDTANALLYYRKGIEIAGKCKDWYDLAGIYDDMSALYVSIGNYKSAYECMRLYDKYSKLYVASARTPKYIDAQVKYNTFLREREIAEMSSTLLLHKYLTYGLALALILFIIIGILLYRQFRLNSMRKLSEMNHLISEMTQKNLRQQMNPHFIFNTLNSIQYYMYQHDKISTNIYLTKFSNLMRKILENSEQTTVPLKDELDALQLYLELEQLRFKDKFEYALTVDENIDTLDYKIPTMFIQPFVENSIGHGLMHKESGGHLKIELKLRGEFIECSIEDNGIGRDAAKLINMRKEKHRSLGTHITQSRLNLVNSLYGKNMQINYTDLINDNGTAAGTRVVVHIPVMT